MIEPSGVPPGDGGGGGGGVQARGGGGRHCPRSAALRGADNAEGGVRTAARREVRDDPVAARRRSAARPSIAGGDAQDPDPGPVPGLDVERRVAGRDRPAAVEPPVGGDRGAVERLAADVDPGVGVGAVAAECEEAVEVSPGELRVRRGFGVARDQPDQAALAGRAARAARRRRASPGSRASSRPPRRGSSGAAPSASPSRRPRARARSRRESTAGRPPGRGRPCRCIRGRRPRPRAARGTPDARRDPTRRRSRAASRRCQTGHGAAAPPAAVDRCDCR